MSYSGNLLINSRTITDGLQKVAELAKTKSSSRNELSIDDLASILTLLEAISTSNSLMYDGTLPQRQLDTIAQCEDEFEGQLSDKSLLSTAAPPTEALLDLCAKAILETAPTLQARIQDFLSNPNQLSDNLKDVDALAPRRYFKAVEGRRKKPSGFTDRMVKAFSHELVARSSATGHIDQCHSILEQNFTGAKCVAGLLRALHLTDQTSRTANATRILEWCAKQIELCHGRPEHLRYLVPLCINTFRSSLLPILATDYGSEEGKGLYFSTARFTPIFKRRAELFATTAFDTFVERKIKSKIKDEDLVSSVFRADDFPFFGLLFVLNASDGDPYSAFQNAIENRHVSAASHVEDFASSARVTKPYRYNQSVKEIEDAHTKLLEKVCRRIDSKVWREQNIKQPLSFGVTRAVHMGARLAPWAQLAMAGLSSDLMVEYLPEFPWLQTGDGSAPAPLSGTGMEVLISQKFKDPESLAYVAFAQTVDQALREALANAETNRVVAERVEKVFNCTLVESYS
ncbi:MAG: hypothetical protein AAGH60_08640 [Pseudomonadota bacterium]